MARYRGGRWRDLGIADGELQNQQMANYRISKYRDSKTADVELQN